MVEPTDQSVAEVIDDVLKNDLNCLMDAPSSALQNHQIGWDGARREVYVIVDIRPQDLNMNNTVELSEGIRKWVRDKGCPDDEPGLIVPAEFGGTADALNVIQWSPMVSSIFCYCMYYTLLDGYHCLGQRQARDS